MRTLVLIGLASLALAAGASDAEARGGRFRFGGLRGHAPVPAASIHSIAREPAPAPGLAIRPDMGGAARPTYVVLPSLPHRPEAPDARSAASTTPEGKPAETPAPVAAKATEAAPWCRSRRIVGTGAGFCLIN